MHAFLRFIFVPKNAFNNIINPPKSFGFCGFYLSSHSCLNSSFPVQAQLCQFTWLIVVKAQTLSLSVLLYLSWFILPGTGCQPSLCYRADRESVRLSTHLSLL